MAFLLSQLNRERLMQAKYLVALSLALSSCGFFTSGFKTKALPSVDFLTLAEVRDTSYCNSRSMGGSFQGLFFFDTRDSAFSSVEIDSAYSRPLFDFDKMRDRDSLGTLSRSFYLREKENLVQTYNILKGGRQ